MKGLPPFALVKRVEKAIDNQEVDDCIFALTLVLGRYIGHCFAAEHHETVLAHCLETIRNSARATEEEERPARSRPS